MNLLTYLLTYLLTSAAFIGAGICFGAQPTGAWGPLLCGMGIIGILWMALKEKKRDDEEKERFDAMLKEQQNARSNQWREAMENLARRE